MGKKYHILYADPPWQFNNKRTGGSMLSGSEAHYSTMTTEEICNLPVQNIIAEDSILFMWWVASQPKEAVKVAEAWGYKVKTMSGFNWVKTTKHGKLFFGMGFYTRAGSELCMIATRGKIKRVNAGIRSVIMAEAEKHSKKPDIFRTEIEKLMDGGGV